MTPEERAENIARRYSNDYEDWDETVSVIANEIRAAITEEREACAQLVASFCDAVRDLPFGEVDEALARAIRAR